MILKANKRETVDISRRYNPIYKTLIITHYKTLKSNTFYI